ncbi:MAG TPA: hypothetical protein ENJ56_01945 [Anaerolineae bacterium]|nr:hypothetical protein [Anaerolineae bacterium]
MKYLSLRERIKLNGLVAQYADVSDPTISLALFERVLASSGSAETAFDAVRESGHRRWQQHIQTPMTITN